MFAVCTYLLLFVPLSCLLLDSASLLLAFSISCFLLSISSDLSCEQCSFEEPYEPESGLIIGEEYEDLNNIADPKERRKKEKQQQKEKTKVQVNVRLESKASIVVNLPRCWTFSGFYLGFIVWGRSPCVAKRP